MGRAQDLINLCEFKLDYNKVRVDKVENDGGGEYVVHVVMPWPKFKGPDGESMQLTIKYESNADGLIDPEIQSAKTDTDGTDYELTPAQETQVLKFLDADSHYDSEVYRLINKWF